MLEILGFHINITLVTFSQICGLNFEVSWQHMIGFVYVVSGHVAMTEGEPDLLCVYTSCTVTLYSWFSYCYPSNLFSPWISLHFLNRSCDKNESRDVAEFCHFTLANDEIKCVSLTLAVSSRLTDQMNVFSHNKFVDNFQVVSNF